MAISLLVILLAIVLVIGIFLLFYDNSYSLTGNAIGNCRDVQVPYQQTENYIESVPYQAPVPINYKTIDRYSDDCSSGNNYKECYYVSVENTADFGAEFGLDCLARVRVNRDNNNSYDDYRYDYRNYYNIRLHDYQYIRSGDTRDLVCEVGINKGDDVSWDYYVIPPATTEVQYRNVQKTRTVTNYRTERVCN